MATDRARSRRNANSFDLLRCLAFILIPIALVGALMTINLDDAPVRPINYTPQLTTAREEAPYPVLAPVGLPGEWVPTSATWTKVGGLGLNDEPAVRNEWKLGFLSPDKVYYGLSQGDVETKKLVSEATREGVEDGESVVRGATWQRLISPDGRTRSLVQSGDEVTTIVSADTEYPALDAYAATLKSG